MKIGYARTSTVEQQAGIEAQIRDLEAVGCERVWREHVSSVVTRPQLALALDFVRGGDVLIVTKLDRLARSIPDLWGLIGRLEQKGVALQILNMGLDSGTATGKLMLNVVGSVAQFEREMMLERQREGIAKAKAEGKYKGQPSHARAKADRVLALAAEGKTRAAIAEAVGMSERSVYRILAD
jgi:DNA invertase Pin-like site-specific DNA recombinase